MRNIHMEPGESKAKLTALAQLIQLYADAKGITSTAELSVLTGYTERAIRKAKAELGCRNQGSAGTRVPEPECRGGTPVPPDPEPQFRPEPECRNQGSEIALARVIDNSSLTSLEETPVDIKTPLPPTKTKLGRIDALRAFEAYNATAQRCALPQASKLTPDRERKIIARLKDFGAEGWARALANIEKSKFLTGSNDRGFRANLDFMLQAGSFAKLHDGGYGNGRHAEIKFTASPVRETEEAARRRNEQWLRENGCMPS